MQRHLAIAALVLLQSCGIGSTVPPGPISGRSVGPYVDWAVGYVPVSVSGVVRSDSPRQALLSGNSYAFGFPIPAVPMRLGARYAPATFVDLAADVGWLDHGLRVRLGHLDSRAAVPVGISAGVRWGHEFWSPLTSKTGDLQLQLEAYPFLFHLDSHTRIYLASALGVGEGAYLLNLFGLPEEALVVHENPVGVSALALVSRETRAEASLGLHAIRDAARVTVAFQPYLTGKAELLASECQTCAFEVTDYSHRWGVLLTASAAGMLEF